MPRTVTIDADTNDLIGDETYEAWLKHDGEWTLVDAGSVEQVLDTQTFTFPGLIDGDPYSLQIRMKRAGRYRIGYLSSDPESWPAQSRVDFTPGSLIGIAAPTLNSVADWERTDADSTKFALVITPNSVDHDLELYDNGALIHTFAAPLASPINYDVADPTAGINHSFKARHVDGTLGGPFSATITKFAGPGPATNFQQTSDPSNYGDYTVTWDDDDRHYRLEDDYLCNGTTYVATDTDNDTGTATITKEMTIMPEGATQAITFRARIRAEVTTFGVTDYSAWDQINIEMTIDDPDDGPAFYNSCP